MQIPTCQIVSLDTPSGYMLINASDFDPAKHELYGVEPKGAGKGEKGAGKGEK